MHIPLRKWARALPLVALASAGTANAYDPIVSKQGWVRVDSYQDQKCYGEIGTNGRFYVLAVYGLEPGERAELTITNGDMRPIRREVRANAGGKWSDYYIPFRFGAGEGGYVTATISGQSCQVPLGFSWQRNKGWEEKPSLRNPYR
ncbi:MAG: hypothetical protein H6918_09355 [Sphingomonadaceae bacterium]|nr:hypothetical protein [Sphingomonadaceae bacterium]